MPPRREFQRAGIAVRLADQHAGVGADILCQRPELGRVALEQDCAGRGRKARQRQGGGARIVLFRPFADELQPVFKACRGISLQQGKNSGIRLAALAGLRAGQVISSAARMCFHIEDRTRSLRGAAQDKVQNGVLQHVGAVARVKAVLIGQHRRLLTAEAFLAGGFELVARIPGWPVSGFRDIASDLEQCLDVLLEACEIPVV